MPTPIELFQSGKLTEAIASVTESVRNNPSDIQPRSLMSELLCFSGDLERADKQLDAAIQIDPDAAIGISLLRHLIRSELSRREVFDEGRMPEFLTQPSTAIQNRLKAVICIRENEYGEAARLIEAASEEESQISGKCNGTEFEDMQDLDDVLGPVIEVYTATGKYYWLSADQVVSLEFSEIDHLSDILWRAAEIQTVGDVSGRVHVPALYHNSHTNEDERVRIGRTTDWLPLGDSEVVRGVGQREWLIGEDAVPFLDIKEITFNSAAPESGEQASEEAS